MNKNNFQKIKNPIANTKEKNLTKIKKGKSSNKYGYKYHKLFNIGRHTSQLSISLINIRCLDAKFKLILAKWPILLLLTLNWKLCGKQIGWLLCIIYLRKKFQRNSFLKNHVKVCLYVLYKWYFPPNLHLHRNNVVDLT